MQFPRRTRKVYFRVTAAEYDELQRACASEGAHGISEFARAAVLGVVASTSQSGSVTQSRARIDRALQIIRAEVRTMMALTESLPVVTDRLQSPPQ
jgi:hypothetical protein